MVRKAFIEDTIDDYSLSLSNEEKEYYEEGKQIHKYCQQWNKKFNNCSSYEELVKVVEIIKNPRFLPLLMSAFSSFNIFLQMLRIKNDFLLLWNICPPALILNTK